MPALFLKFDGASRKGGLPIPVGISVGSVGCTVATYCTDYTQLLVQSKGEQGGEAGAVEE
ncbi:hypothetical protein RRF57_008686 [Xylaria bambusicola]|uniref:Uncharacterized protein n=1 Tax=Xylaria bambusicola TaxID=326684 RepID=A0AAN7Z788_9PEZI